MTASTANSIRAHPSDPTRLNILIRFHIYALHGLLTEIFFTAAWEFVASRNWKLTGVSSIWVYFVYGVSMLIMEKGYLLLQDTVPFLLRGVLYMFLCYTLEFSTGYALKKHNACPWDYEPWFDNHYMGLITLEYAPLWYLVTLIGERYVIKNVIALRWSLGGSCGAAAGCPSKTE